MGKIYSWMDGWTNVWLAPWLMCVLQQEMINKCKTFLWATTTYYMYEQQNAATSATAINWNDSTYFDKPTALNKQTINVMFKFFFRFSCWSTSYLWSSMTTFLNSMLICNLSSSRSNSNSNNSNIIKVWGRNKHPQKNSVIN